MGNGINVCFYQREKMGESRLYQWPVLPHLRHRRTADSSGTEACFGFDFAAVSGRLCVATVVEYLIGLILEKLSIGHMVGIPKALYIKGRVCLERSVEWGVLTAFVMRVVQPVIADFVAAIPRAWGEFAATLLLAYLAVDTTITVLQILRFNEKLASLSEAHDALQKKLEGTKALCFPTGNHYAFRELACCGISA